MATDATGIPTSPDNIPTYNTAADSPSGLGFNAAMAAIQTALNGRPATPAGILTGEAMVWNGATFVRSSVTKLGALSIAGQALASGTKTTSVSSAGTTFGTGVDVLAAALNFTADGVSSYVLTICARTWNNNTAGASLNLLNINLDGVDKGQFAEGAYTTAGAGYGLNARGLIVTPSAGAHTVNARLLVNAGTGTIAAGVGGVGADVPILVTVETI